MGIIGVVIGALEPHKNWMVAGAILLGSSLLALSIYYKPNV
jgi:hypothetical protein